MRTLFVKKLIEAGGAAIKKQYLKGKGEEHNVPDQKQNVDTVSAIR